MYEGHLACDFVKWHAARVIVVLEIYMNLVGFIVLTVALVDRLMLNEYTNVRNGYASIFNSVVPVVAVVVAAVEC